MPQAATVDVIFRALGDPTRRGVVERLSRSPASVTQLAEPYDMALSSFGQHLRVLEDSGLVSSKKVGRVRTYRLAPKKLVEAEGWLAHHRALSKRRFDQLDAYVMTLKEKSP